MSTLNQGKVEREHEVSLSRLELNHDSLPTSKLAASDRLHAMYGIIGAEQHLRLAHAIPEQSRDLRRHPRRPTGEIDHDENRIVAAGTGERIHLLAVCRDQIPLARRDGRVAVAHAMSFL